MPSMEDLIEGVLSKTNWIKDLKNNKMVCSKGIDTTKTKCFLVAFCQEKQINKIVESSHQIYVAFIVKIND